MGQTYSVKIKLKYNNGITLRDSLITAMREQHCNWNCDLSYSGEFNVISLLKMFLYDINFKVTQYKNGTYELNAESCFDQSYSWECIMYNIFHKITPVLNNGSSLTIYPDSDYTRLVIKNHECVCTH